MRPVVRDNWIAYTTGLEGRVSTMYLDCLGLVTIGLGCLIDPVRAATTLPFVHRVSGAQATTIEVSSEWYKIKSQPGLAKLHWKYAAAQCKLRLLESGIDSLALQRLELNNATLLRFLPDFEEWPANAQLATHSMSWAMGAGFMAPHGTSRGFPSWWAAAKRQDWLSCAQQCKINSKGNPGVIPRNERNVAQFRAAANGDPDELLRTW
jgi:GH24 family phage-related lysozyme (muramidase)